MRLWSKSAKSADLDVVTTFCCKKNKKKTTQMHQMTWKTCGILGLTPQPWGIFKWSWQMCKFWKWQGKNVYKRKYKIDPRSESIKKNKPIVHCLLFSHNFYFSFFLSWSLACWPPSRVNIAWDVFFSLSAESLRLRVAARLHCQGASAPSPSAGPSGLSWLAPHRSPAGAGAVHPAGSATAPSVWPQSERRAVMQSVASCCMNAKSNFKWKKTKNKMSMKI